MKEIIKRQTHIIDATDKVLGRLAAEVAVLLRGKQRPDYMLHKDTGDFVLIKNIKNIKVTGNKMKDKLYYRHSGYRGHLKKIPMGDIFAKTPERILKMAVLGMLPKNKLRAQQIKRLSAE